RCVGSPCGGPWRRVGQRRSRAWFLTPRDPRDLPMSSTAPTDVSVVPLPTEVAGEPSIAPASIAPGQGAHAGSEARVFRDLIALTKPRITATVVLTMFGGLWLGARRAEVELPPPVLAAAVAGTAFVVAGANALNMYLERDSDAFMG